MNGDNKRRRPPGRRRRGYTLVELVIAVAIVGILAKLAVQNFTVFTSRAKRNEAYQALHVLAAAEEEFFANHGRYSGSFVELGFTLKGGKLRNAGSIDNGRYKYTLSQPGGTHTWYCSAVGNLDNDAWQDVLVASDYEK